MKPDAKATGSKEETTAVAVFAAEETATLAVSGTDPERKAPEADEAPETTSE